MDYSFQGDWLTAWLPILIAILALGISIWSAFWAVKQYIKSSRPYVHAVNYIEKGNNFESDRNAPERLALIIINSPAKILHMEVRAEINGDILIKPYIHKDFVKFPYEKTDWSFNWEEDEYMQIMTQFQNIRGTLYRIVIFKYTSLNGGRIFNYELRQKFMPEINQWIDDYEMSD